MTLSMQEVFGEVQVFALCFIWNQIWPPTNLTD